PETINGITVTALGNRLFENNITLQYITLPSTCKEIKSYAFKNCTSLKEVYAPNVTTMSGNTFTDCTALITVYFPELTTIDGWHTFCDCTALENVYLPKLETITGVGTFMRCKSLTEISLPSVTYLDRLSFDYCENLATISIPKVETIGEECFTGCKALTSFTIPTSTTSIGDHAFDKNLTSISIAEGSTSFYSDSRALYSKDTLLMYFTSNTSTEYTPLGSGNINGFNYNITTIGKYAFSRLYTNPDTILQKVILPDTYTTINTNAFSYCTNLSYIYGPKVTTIKNYAFDECSFNCIKDITPTADITNGAYFPKIQNIGGYCFWNNDSLEIIDIKNDINIVAYDGSYDYYVFSNCKNLNTVSLPNLTSLPQYTFSNCPNLKSFEIGAKVSRIEGSAFDTFALENISIADGNKYFYADGRALYNSNTLIFYVLGNESAEYTALSEVTINGVTTPITTIGKSAFRPNSYNTTYIKRITLPNTYITIKASAFSSLKSIEYIYGPKVENIESHAAFQSSSITYLTDKYPENSTVKNADGKVIGAYFPSIKSLGSSCFASSKLEKVEINSPVTLDSGAFNTSTLTYASLPNITAIPNYCFETCSNLPSFNIGQKVNSIGQKAFHTNTQLIFDETSHYFDDYGLYNYNTFIQLINTPANGIYTIREQITLDKTPSQITTIAKNAFYDKTLTELILPESITTIGENAFYYSKIGTLTLPESVQSIGADAFTLSKITTLYYNAINATCTTHPSVDYIYIGENVTNIPTIFNQTSPIKITFYSQPTLTSNCLKLDSITNVYLDFNSPTSTDWLTSLNNSGITNNLYTIYSKTQLPNTYYRNINLIDDGYDGSYYKYKVGGTIETTCGANGTISSPNLVQFAGDGGSAELNYTITPNANYRISSVKINGFTQTISNPTGANTYTLTKANKYQNIEATFSKITYTINASAGAGGSISPTSATVEHGGSITFTFNHNTGYEVDDVLVDNVSQGAITSYEFTDVISSHEIYVKFKKISCYITMRVGPNGSVTPSDTYISVEYGGSITFTFTPDDGYEVDQIYMSPALSESELNTARAENKYTLESVTIHAQTILVTFRAKSNIVYTIKHLQQNLDGITYTEFESETKYGTTGSTTNATAKSYDGFTAQTVTQLTINGNGSTVVEIKYTRNSYTLTLSKDTGIYSVSGNGTYKYEQSVSISAVVNQGYQWYNWTGHSTVTTNSYTFNMPAQHISYTANATPIEYSISIDTLTNGSITQTTSVDLTKVKCTDTVTFKVEANVGYSINEIKVNGSNVTLSASNTFTLTNVVEDKTISATFTANSGTQYTVKHLQQNLDGTTYTEFESETKYGTTGDTTNAQAKPYNGFTAQTITQTTINGNGSTVVEIKYTRNSYTLTLSKDTGIYSVSGNGAYKYGAEVTISATVSDGYSWANWSGYSSSNNNPYIFNIPASDVSFTANAYINQYMIISEVIGANGSVVSSSATVEYDGSVTFTFTPTTGYEINSITINETNILNTDLAQIKILNTYILQNIKESITLKVSFTAKSGIDYTVKHWKQNLSGVDYNILADTENLTGKTNDIGTYTAKSYTGFTFSHADNKSISGDGSTIINVYYTRNSYDINISYSGNGSVSPNTTQQIKYEDNIEFKITPAIGYEIHSIKVDGFGIDDDTFNNVVNTNDFTILNITKETDIDINFVAKTNTKYTVKHWIEKLDGSYEETLSEDLYGTTDTSATFTEQDYDGFTFSYADNKTINGDETSIVNVYYTRNEYNLTLYKGNGVEYIESSVLGRKVKYGETIELKSSVLNGYQWIQWKSSNESILPNIVDPITSFTMPAGDIQLTAEASILRFTINVIQTENGSITTNSSIPLNFVTFEDIITFNISPNNDFEIEDVLVNDISVGVVNTYTFKNIYQSQSITAKFKKIIKFFDIKIDIEGEGTITGDSFTHIQEGETIILDVESSCDNIEIYINGVKTEIVDSKIIIENINSDISIQAIFKNGTPQNKFKVKTLILIISIVVGILITPITIVIVRYNKRKRSMKLLEQEYKNSGNQDSIINPYSNQQRKTLKTSKNKINNTPAQQYNSQRIINPQTKETLSIQEQARRSIRLQKEQQYLSKIQNSQMQSNQIVKKNNKQS
ncbi:MAG: leucine-rich repeat protein, partial [Clostridia bacterium]